MQAKGLVLRAAGFLALLGLVSGCYDPALRGMQEYEKSFSCSAQDFKKLEAMVHKYFSGPKTLKFADGSEATFQIATRLNELLAQRCSQEVLRECTDGHLEGYVYGDGDYTYASRVMWGPLEDFGILSLTSTTYETLSAPHTIWLTELSDPQKFQQAVKCFSKKRN